MTRAASPGKEVSTTEIIHPGSMSTGRSPDPLALTRSHKQALTGTLAQARSFGRQLSLIYARAVLLVSPMLSPRRRCRP
eukprot:2537550-Pleurochrysis_carterae.AAC.1